jgi:hypothetical protein
VPYPSHDVDHKAVTRSKDYLMNGYRLIALFIPALLSAFVVNSAAQNRHDGGPPFGLTQLQPVDAGANHRAQGQRAYGPKNPYNIFINYELGMHCVGLTSPIAASFPPTTAFRPRLFNPE